MELQLSGYAQPITQTQWNFDYLVMHLQPHRYNGITIIWLCTTNNTDTMECSTFWLCTTNHTDTIEFQSPGYAPPTPTDAIELQVSGYALLTTQIQWNFDSLVMHH